MGAIAVPIVIVLIAVVLLVAGARTVVSRGRDQADQLADQSPPPLRFHLPPGVDRAAVLAALAAGGYEAAADPAPDHLDQILIAGRDGTPPDRDGVRTALAGAVGVSPPVRFADES